MTENEIRARLKIIELYASNRDHEAAHSAEDRLYRDYLYSLKDKDPLAALVLSSRRIDFVRSCI